MTSFKIVPVDPYHPVLGYLFHPITQRLLEQNRQLGDSELAVVNVMSRLTGLDPTVLVLACLNDKGEVKGHTVATIEGNVAYMNQPRLDESTENDTTGELLALVEKWVKQYNTLEIGNGHPNIQVVTLVARRSDPKWAKKYGFETTRYVMQKKLGE